jgi:AbrB family looped-hinge helix DNA binding protein
MPLVTVKTKYQVTLPTAVRKQAKLAVGDILEAKVEGKKITLTPKSLVDRELAHALEDVRKGRVVGPFNQRTRCSRIFTSGWPSTRRGRND